MNGAAIIAKFRTRIDSQDELTDDEAIDLVNTIYKNILNDRDWEFLKKTYSGTTSTSVDYVALPSDFKYMSPNQENKMVVFIGTGNREYQVIPYQRRRDYRNADGYCYLDMRQSRLYFTKQPTAAESIEYEYIYDPGAITTSTSPVFHSDYHEMIAYGMAEDWASIDESEKGRSYYRENGAKFKFKLDQMAMDDARIKLSI